MHKLGHPAKSIIESMEMGWLPSPPHVFNKLLDICRDPDSSITDLADLIGSDAALTGKLIMAVNSSAFTINQPINNLQQAITIVGHDLVKTMILTSSIQQLFSGLVNARKKTVCKLWLDSLYCATFSQGIAQALNYEQHQDAYLAGLLHDFGQIALDARYQEQYVDILNSKTEDEIVLKEISTFGISHMDLGADIIERWPSLSPAIADAARFHHEAEQRLQGCDLLCQIVAEAGQAAWHWGQAGEADNRWHSTLIADEDKDNIYTQVQDRMSRIATNMGIPFPGTGSLTQQQLSGDLEKVTIKLGRKIRDASLINVINSKDDNSIPVNSPSSLLVKIARELQIIFSITNVVLLMPDSKNADFLALYELNQASPVSKFPIYNNNSKMVRSFLEKSDYWIEPRGQHDETTPVTDLQILRRLKHEIAFSIPLGYGDQIIGVVIIGAHKAQKSYLASQSNFISGYLGNIAQSWLKNTRELQHQTFENDSNRARDQKDIDKLLHEISNPLSVIGNYIEIIKSHSNSESNEIDKEITILKEELQRIRSIVLDFKDTRISDSEPIWLNEELKICIPMYVKSIGEGKEVQVSWALDGSDAEVSITRDTLRQIILNLVKNAIEAQTDDPMIVVSSHHFVNIDGVFFAQFSISDRGTGIDAITRQLLFSPLTTTKSGAGRGLGLSVVSEILTKFSGQIKYLENEFGGASFEVLIPQSHEHSADQ